MHPHRVHLGGMEWSFLVNVHFPPNILLTNCCAPPPSCPENEERKYWCGETCEPHTFCRYDDDVFKIKNNSSLSRESYIFW